MAWKPPADQIELGQRLVAGIQGQARRPPAPRATDEPGSESRRPWSATACAASPTGRARAATGGASTSWPDAPEFHEFAAPGVPGAGARCSTDPTAAAQFLQADGRLAGAGRPHRLHAPAGREDRAVRAAAGGDRSRAAALLRDRDAARAATRAACWSRATRAGRPRSRATPTTRPASAPPTCSRQASVLGLYDPDRSQDGPRRRRGLATLGRLPWPRCAQALDRQQAHGRRGAAHPHRPRHLADARRADRAAARRLPAAQVA